MSWYQSATCNISLSVYCVITLYIGLSFGSPGNPEGQLRYTPPPSTTTFQPSVLSWEDYTWYTLQHASLQDCGTFVQKIFSKPLHCVQPNLVWWHIIMTRSVLWQGLLPPYKVKVTVHGQYTNNNNKIRQQPCSEPELNWVIKMVTFLLHPRVSITDLKITG